MRLKSVPGIKRSGIINTNPLMSLTPKELYAVTYLAHHINIRYPKSTNSILYRNFAYLSEIGLEVS